MADPAGLRLALVALRRGLISQDALTRAIREQEAGKDREGLIDILVRQGDLGPDGAEAIRRSDHGGGATQVDSGGTLGDPIPGGPSPATLAGAGSATASGAPTIPGAVIPAASDATRADAGNRTRLGEYLISRILGSGGMGVVYEAIHEPLKRKVALKVLSPQLAEQEASLQRFYREVRAAARLHHPNIVPVFDVGQEGSTHFFAMEYIEGKTLEQLSRDGDLSYEEVARAVKAIAEALHYAHGQGIVHRDVKPSNIISTREGRVLIADFGVAKELTEAGITASGALLGTPSYMSPEQAAGGKEPVTARTDVYSLGATLYDLATKQRPFVGESFESTLAKVLFQEPERPCLVRPGVPHDLETIILKAMAKEPDRRYATAEDLANDLGRFLRGEPILARPMTTVNRVMRKLRRHRMAAAAWILALCVVGVGGGLLWSALEAQKAEAARLERERGQRDRELAVEREGQERERREREALEKRQSESRATVKSALLMKQHTPGDAIPMLDKAIELDPTNAEAWLERGRFHREQGEFRPALEDLKKAIELAPDQIDAYAERMTAYLCTNDFLRVAGDLDTILKRWPDHRYARMGKAALLYLKGDKETAAKEFAKLTLEMPNEALAFAGLGGCLLETGKPNEALKALNRAIEIEPKNVMALNNRAQLFLDASQWDAAISDASRSVEYFASFFWPWEIRGKARFQKGLLKEAEDDLEQAVKLGPTQGDACLFLTATYYFEGKYPVAIKAATRALKLKANKVDGLFYRSLSYAATGQLAEAEADAAEMEKAGHKGYAETAQAAVALKRGEPDVALEKATQALAAQPRMIEAMVVRARAHAAKGRHDDALDDYRNACALDQRQLNLLMPEINEVKRLKAEAKRAE